MAHYVYPAVFKREDSGLYAVEFPDIPGCFTSGDDLDDAMLMAEDALAFMLYGYEKEKKEIPKPSKLTDIENDGKSFVNYIRCDTLWYRKKNSGTAVKKTLTIPEWLNEAAVEANLNFSQILQDALKTKLGM